MAYAINLICVTMPKLRISLNKFVEEEIAFTFTLYVITDRSSL